MKKLCVSIIFIASPFLLHALSEKKHVSCSDKASFLSLQATTTWHDFSKKTSNPFQEKSALTNKITLQTKETLRIKKITLLWEGPQLKTLSASLYQKHHYYDKLIPIEENLVSDGIWNTSKQKFIFFVDEKLVAKHHYYLVLNFPFHLEKEIRSGSFSCKVSQ